MTDRSAPGSGDAYVSHGISDLDMAEHFLREYVTDLHDFGCRCEVCLFMERKKATVGPRDALQPRQEKSGSVEGMLDYLGALERTHGVCPGCGDTRSVTHAYDCPWWEIVRRVRECPSAGPAAAAPTPDWDSVAGSFAIGGRWTSSEDHVWEYMGHKDDVPPSASDAGEDGYTLPECPSSFTDRDDGHRLYQCELATGHEGHHAGQGAWWTDSRTGFPPPPHAAPDVSAEPTKGPTGMCSCDPKFSWDRHACKMGKLTRNPESFCTCRCHTPPWRTEPSAASAGAEPVIPRYRLECECGQTHHVWIKNGLWRSRGESV